MDILILFGLLLALMLVGVPVAFSIGLSAIVVAVLVLAAPPIVVATKLLDGVNVWTWVAIPLFIFLGNIMNVSGIANRLINFSQALVGHVHGSLSHVTVVTNVLMAGMSGSAVADAAATGSMLIPGMRKAGYPGGYAAAIVATSALIGPLIPPSIPFIMIGMVADISILRLWLGGAVPGLLLGLILLAVGYVKCRGKDYPRQERRSARQISRATLQAVPVLLLPFVIIGGMRAGLFTPTEAAAVAVGYVIMLAFLVHREASLGDVLDAGYDAFKASAAVILIIGASSIFSWDIAALRAAPMLVEFFRTICGDSAIAFLFVIIVAVVILGAAIEVSPMILIFSPLLVPVAVEYGVDPVHFGVLFGLAVLTGNLTPPVGLIMFVVCPIANATVWDFVREGWPLFLGILGLLVIVALFPQVVLFLPNLMLG